MFPNGTCVLTLQLPTLINVCYVFCYRWSLSTKKLRNLVLRKPYGYNNIQTIKHQRAPTLIYVHFLHIILFITFIPCGGKGYPSVMPS